MSVTAMVALVMLTSAVGLLVGAVGIGGVVLVPLMNLVLSVDLKVAIASCLLSYLFSGVVSVWLYRRYGSIQWRPAALLTLGAIPGAFLGATAVDFMSVRGLLLAISALMLGAGVHALVGSGKVSRDLDATSDGLMLGLGLLVGFVSALTGTGGAVTLVPLLLAMGFAPLPAIGLGQVMQLPVAISGSARNLPAGLVDFELTGLLAIGLAGGAIVGARFAHRLPTRTLRRILAALLIAFGAGLALKTGFR